MITKGKMYQHFIIRVYPIGKPRRTVSVNTLPNHTPDYVSKHVIKRIEKHNKIENFECVFPWFGKVKIYCPTGY